MGKRLTDREKLLFKLDHLSDGEVHELLEYVSIMQSMRREEIDSDGIDDELLTMLASAHVNQRARQDFVWETTRRQVDYPHTGPHQMRR